ncbi:alpha/beta hydrolase fold domain-containing protein [Streptomyces sp. NPDC090106]|uniref:alpha/beta hydrolase fold domain-containing protein n=1 Tax=Streptomyces sp. NPDC090106 TaxID=3365946 RepID=UPI0038120CA3
MTAHDDLRSLIAAPHPDLAPLPPAAPVGAGVRLLRGVPYADVPGARPLELDLWLPENPGRQPLPLVLFVHGGAWRRGRREDMGYRTRAWNPGPFARIAGAGFAVASADYRLSGEALFPAQLDDLRQALRWLATRAPELGVDTARTVVWGESAGGQLAALLALADDTPGVVGAVVWYAPSDLTEDGDNAHSPEALLLGGAPATVPENAALASPLLRAHAGAPPMFLAHGEDDSMVSCDHTRRLAARLTALGVPVESRLVPGADHVWHGLSEERLDEVFRTSLTWARRRVERRREAQEPSPA